MIRTSSNSAATAVLNKVGKYKLIKILKLPEYKLYDPTQNKDGLPKGGLWVGKEYGRGTAYKKSSIGNMSHGATTNQVANYYYMLESNKLVSKELTKEMKEILSKPGINHKFVQGLRKMGVPNKQILRKSGSWKEFNADSVVVEHNGAKYIAIAIGKKKENIKDTCFAKLIVKLDQIALKPYMKQEQHLQPTNYDKSLAVK